MGNLSGEIDLKINKQGGYEGILETADRKALSSGHVNFYITTKTGEEYLVASNNGDLWLQSMHDDFIGYFNRIENCDYTILMAGADDVSTNLTKKKRECLKNLGIQSDLKNKSGYSFYAIVENGTVIEDVSEEAQTVSRPHKILKERDL
ncbi:hypothetical protein [Butyrivibrio sp. FC2001]|uniref:hypothetical protein n=1 Tax=Butyrivibrio sp. FC2001 TaxID=1280671 RepID=UPI0004140FCC|nr:hypothetical protein [Butyrivibrio sp. FC2001]